MAAPAQAVKQPATRLSSTAVDSSEAQSASEAVAAEDLRLTQVRRGPPRAPHQRKLVTPYTLRNASGDTLVLTARSTPYALADLLRLAPHGFARIRDGSYLLSENIVVLEKATLRLSAPDGLTLHLASGPVGFVSIVSLGGRLELMGQENAHVTLSSWDVNAGAPDTDSYDGRAYLRTIDGTFTSSYVDASDLGFWSGRTGGLALTGTALPPPKALEPTGGANDGALSRYMSGDLSPQLPGPAHAIPSDPKPKRTVPAQVHVSDRITNTSITGNAFGLFVSGTNGISITDTKVTDSLNSGVVLHRYVTNGVLSRTSANDNGGNGFVVDRASTDIRFSQTTANNNAGSGFMVSGLPEADGSSVSGASTISYGNTSIADSTASGNSRYGIHIIGGTDISVKNNRVTDSDMGIMVTGPAGSISIIDNEIANVRRHAIALVDRTSLSTVTGNAVDHTSTGIYIRDSVGQVSGNRIQNANTHGVTLVGNVSGSEVADNVLAGSGVSAVELDRSSGAVALGTGNQVGGWNDNIDPWSFILKKLLQPMTFLWAMIALLLTLSAVRSRKESRIEHPYAHQMAHQGLLPMPDHR